jgi:hypothetical protein
MPRTRPKRIFNAQKIHVLIEKEKLDEINKSGLSQADFIRCSINAYLEKRNPRDLSAIKIRYKYARKKIGEGTQGLSQCRKDLVSIGLSESQVSEIERGWSEEMLDDCSPED